jgi:hypothetical protein
MEALGPGLSDVVLRVCCFLEGLETTERRLGWSARSGKVVLKIGLQRLLKHYKDRHGFRARAQVLTAPSHASRATRLCASCAVTIVVSGLFRVEPSSRTQRTARPMRDLKLPEERHPEKAHRADNAQPKKPSWIRVKAPVGEGYRKTHRSCASTSW